MLISDIGIKCKIILILLLTFMIAFVTGCTDEKNNISSHFMKDGTYTFYNDWIYYSNNNDENKLYRMRGDGTESTKILDETVIFGIIADKDGLFFLKMEFDQTSEEKKTITKICTSTLDGNDEKVLITDGKIYCLLKNGEWLYYAVNSNDSKKEGIYRIKTDGSKNQLLYNGYSLGLNITKDKLYFTVAEGIMSLNLDGTNKKLLYKTPSTSDLIYYNNHLYFSDYNNIYSLNLNGTNKTRINKIVEYHSSVEYVINDLIYFIKYNEDNHSLCKANLDGSDETTIFDAERIEVKYILNETIYFYYLNGNDSFIAKINKDGSCFEEISKY